jgi:CRP/FNR family cyclic AMP-dependent transcriptional regulator
MSAKTFADLVDTTPSIATKLIHPFCHIIRGSDDRIMDVTTMRSVQRVCQELMRLSGGVIHPLPAQGEIAGLASTTRETVGRVFHELTAAGIIERKQRASTSAIEPGSSA